MNFSLFWDAGARFCVAICRGLAGIDLALSATDETGQQSIVATDGGTSIGELRLLLGTFPERTREFSIVELDRPQQVKASFSLAALSSDEPSSWRSVMFARGASGRPDVLRVNPDVPSDNDRQLLRRYFRTTLANNGLAPERAWLVAARASIAGSPRVKESVLIWPSTPTLTVEPVSARSEPPQIIDDNWPTLLKLAYQPIVGEPILELSTSEPNQIAECGRLVAVCISHQLRFFREKDDYLREVRLPGTKPLSLRELLHGAEGDATSPPTQTLGFAWRAGLKNSTRHIRPIVVNIDTTGERAQLSYPDGALGDDLYLVAEQPLLIAKGADKPGRILGFRIKSHGFELLDLNAPDVQSYARDAESYALDSRNEGLGFDDFERRVEPKGPTPHNPLAGFLDVSFEAAKKRGLMLDYSDFVRAPAAILEQFAWRRGAADSQFVGGEPLALALARSAGLVTELSESATLSEQCAVLRCLRRDDAVTLLRAARIRAPTDERRIGSALAVAKVLADPSNLKKGEEIASQRGLADVEALFRRFRSRELDAWSDLQTGELLERALVSFYADAPDWAPDETEEEEESRSSMSIEQALEAFERQLAIAGRMENIDRIQWGKVRDRYHELKIARKLDTHATLPPLRRQLEKLTTGPRIAANFTTAITALEKWANLPGFSARMTSRPETRGAEAVDLDWDGLLTRIQPPRRPYDPDGSWGAAREQFLANVEQSWRAANSELRSDEIPERALTLRAYADALLHHRVYMSLTERLPSSAAARGASPSSIASAAKIVNALRAWPAEAGVVWRAAEDMFGADALRPVVEAPPLSTPQAA